MIKLTKSNLVLIAYKSYLINYLLDIVTHNIKDIKNFAIKFLKILELQFKKVDYASLKTVFKKTNLVAKGKLKVLLDKSLIKK